MEIFTGERLGWNPSRGLDWDDVAAHDFDAAGFVAVTGEKIPQIIQGSLVRRVSGHRIHLHVKPGMGRGQDIQLWRPEGIGEFGSRGVSRGWGRPKSGAACQSQTTPDQNRAAKQPW
jgi:hypothetical protein